ncbi:MAG: hypothetical protein J6S00_06830, partial [Clostridia bacterium]|nr:hypothetical protein [Clostridia bacterium]
MKALKKALSFLLLFLFVFCTFSGCSHSANAKQITLSPNGKNDTDEFKNAIKNIKNGGTIELKNGTYYLDGEIEIKSKSNIKVIGDNVTIIRTGVELKGNRAENIKLFTFDECENIKISGITVKYDAVTSVSGVVTKSMPSSGQVVIKPNENQNPKGNETYCALNTFDELGNPDTKLEKYCNDGFSQTLGKDGTIFLGGLSYDEVNLLTVGTRVGLRTSLSSDLAIKITNTKDIVFEDITIRNSFSGVFFTDGRTENLTLRRINISPEDNENSYFSSNADGLHIAAIGGHLTVEDCTFIKLGDDCVNVHGAAYTVKNVDEKSVVGYHDRYNSPATTYWAQDGDEIEFYDKNSFKLLGSAILKSINSVTGKMTFDKLPEGIKEGAIMANKTMHPTVTISNCTVKSNRARAFLLQTEGAVVKNCDISGTRLAAILIAPDINYWYEMS